MLTQDVPQLLECGIDWITATAKRDGSYDALLTLASDLFARQVEGGDQATQYRALGYDGIQTRHVRYGTGKEGAILVISGGLADEYATRAAMCADHWSRLDFAVTMSGYEPYYNLAEDYYNIAKERAERTGREPGVGYYTKIMKGATAEIGSRVSARYGRCYDKHHESRGVYPPGCWRWETELKRHLSEYHRRRRIERGHSDADIMAEVSHTFTTHGLAVPFNVSSPIDKSTRPSRPRDADRLLRWLETGVAPAVAFCIEARGTAVVRKALGL